MLQYRIHAHLCERSAYYGWAKKPPYSAHFAEMEGGGGTVL